jgi:hypothetical protein
MDNEVRENLLEKLNRMERELEKMRNEAPPYTPPPLIPDKLDAHEETLKSIALKLDTLLADLMEAEVMEYTYPEFLQSDETSHQNNTAAAKDGGLEPRGRSLQEILVIATLIAAVFLVGMTFGLWGSFFFGL